MTTGAPENADAALVVEVRQRARPGTEAEVERLLEQLGEAAQRFPGFVDRRVVQPDGRLGERVYRAIVRFDTIEDFRRWEESTERRSLTDELAGLIEGTREVRLMQGLEPWFAAQPHATAPSRLKMWLVTWVGAFPLLALLLPATTPLRAQLPAMVGIAAVSGATTFLMTFVVMPALTRLLRRWLYPAATS